MSTDTAPDGASQSPHRLYFATRRWHFYSGLYVIPFLLMLAVTGLNMLWVNSVTELNGARGHITPGATLLPVSALVAAAESAVPGGKATQYIAPMDADRVAAFAVATGRDTTGVTLNPYTGAVVETFPWRAGWHDLANDIHGTLLIGDLGDWLIEAAASLGLLLVISGLYLHWPRNGATWGKALTVQRGRGRAFWKSLHGAVGLWVGVILISGLSWAGLWGARFVQAWNTFPTDKRDAVPRPADIPYAKGALLTTLALSLAFPMLGLTLLAVIVLDLVDLAAIPPLKRLVS